jgi:Double-stranded RNA binding motif
MSENAKNRLLELLKNLGCIEDCAQFQTTSPLIAYGQHYTVVLVNLPDGRVVKGTGDSRRKKDAEIAAAMDAIEQLHRNHPDLIIDWDKIKIEAQAGDALIKLGVYLSPNRTSADDNSKQLQNSESDAHLERVFDQWQAQGDQDLAIWGNNLSEKRKATLVEALLWRRFGTLVLASDASEKLQSLLKTLD